MYSKLTSTTPRDNDDGTLSAVLLERIRCGPFGLILRCALPAGPEAAPSGGGPLGAAAGRFFMLRCVDDTPDARHTGWSLYPRRPLFVAELPVAHGELSERQWDLFAPADDRQTITWLQSRPVGARLNLMGPFGRIHNPAGHSRTLLVVSQPQTLPPLLPWIHAMLDQSGRVALILHQAADAPASLLPYLPIPVEIHPAPTTEALHRHLAETLRWADQCIVGLPPGDLPPIAMLIRQQRFRLEPGYALAYVPADFACGFGACLACVVAKQDGSYTRACLNGPFFPLEQLTR